MGLSVELDASLPHRNQLVWGGDVYQDWGLERFANFRPTPDPKYSFAVPPSDRVMLTGFIRDEWRIVQPLALSAGLRYVGSNKLDPLVVTDVAAIWNITGRLYARGAFNEGYRPPSVEACCSAASNSAFGGNPNLLPERSRSAEGELNWVTLQDVGPISKLYLRVDYSFTQLRDVIESIGGQYYNRGNQDVHSVEFLGRLDLNDRSSFWLAYYYVQATDDRNGPLRYPANHILNAAFNLSLLKWLDVTSVFTAVGPREDPNRIADMPNNQATMNSITVDRLAPYYLLRAGLLVHDIPVAVVRDLELRIFADNLLDQRYYTADTQSDDKLNPNSYLRPGFSVFADLSYRIGGAR
jgi:outer membrane receptor protein involved in Fe transport